jgi:hypothetical protein
MRDMAAVLWVEFCCRSAASRFCLQLFHDVPSNFRNLAKRASLGELEAVSYWLNTRVSHGQKVDKDPYPVH